ncbi:MAG: RNA methyltransferase [Firmicutes bacterium]|nr:RNA methyltransferase [Bacillota bacterium]
MRGYFGIGIEHTKAKQNIGTLYRSAMIFGASFIFTIGKRYERQKSDTVKAFRHIPLYHFQTLDDLYEHLPYDCKLIGIEIDDRAIMLRNFVHPERACYLLGAEDEGLSEEARDRCHALIQLPVKDLEICEARVRELEGWITDASERIKELEAQVAVLRKAEAVAEFAAQIPINKGADPYYDALAEAIAKWREAQEGGEQDG